MFIFELMLISKVKKKNINVENQTAKLLEKMAMILFIMDIKRNIRFIIRKIDLYLCMIKRYLYNTGYISSLVHNQ
jgi:hypothetical protein